MESGPGLVPRPKAPEASVRVHLEAGDLPAR